MDICPLRWNFRKSTLADENWVALIDLNKWSKPLVSHRHPWFGHILFITRHDKWIGQSKKLCLTLSMTGTLMLKRVKHQFVEIISPWPGRPVPLCSRRRCTIFVKSRQTVTPKDYKVVTWILLLLCTCCKPPQWKRWGALWTAASYKHTKHPHSSSMCWFKHILFMKKRIGPGLKRDKSPLHQCVVYNIELCVCIDISLQEGYASVRI